MNKIVYKLLYYTFFRTFFKVIHYLKRTRSLTFVIPISHVRYVYAKTPMEESPFEHPSLRHPDVGSGRVYTVQCTCLKYHAIHYVKIE